MSVVISSVSKSLGVPNKKCKSLIKSITDRFPDNKIISVRKDEDSFIFNLLGDIVVKFLPPTYSYPVFELPRGFSCCNSEDLAFNLFSHFAKNKHLLNQQNLSFLERVRMNEKFETKDEQIELYIKIVKTFGIPKSCWRNNALLTTLVKNMLAAMDRIMTIDSKNIIEGSEVKLNGDKQRIHVVAKIKPDFYLRLRGLSGNVDPKAVTLL